MRPLDVLKRILMLVLVFLASLDTFQDVFVICRLRDCPPDPFFIRLVASLDVLCPLFAGDATFCGAFLAVSGAWRLDLDHWMISETATTIIGSAA